MKWVKASERLPEVNIRKLIKAYGHFLTIGFLSTYHPDKFVSEETHSTIDIADIEWLDESPKEDGEDERRWTDKDMEILWHLLYKAEYEDFGEALKHMEFMKGFTKKTPNQ